MVLFLGEWNKRGSCSLILKAMTCKAWVVVSHSDVAVGLFPISHSHSRALQILWLVLLPTFGYSLHGCKWYGQLTPTTKHDHKVSHYSLVIFWDSSSESSISDLHPEIRVLIEFSLNVNQILNLRLSLWGKVCFNQPMSYFPVCSGTNCFF
jgi:hypothetical protein